MNHHKGTEPPIIEKPLRSKIMKDVCKDTWDADFIDKIQTEGGNQQLYDIILAANYMDIKSLLHLGCAKSKKTVNIIDCSFCNSIVFLSNCIDKYGKVLNN